MRSNVIMLINVIIISFTPILLGYLYEKMECNNYGELSGKQTEYRFAGGCFVRTNGGFVSYDKYQQIQLVVE